MRLHPVRRRHLLQLLRILVQALLWRQRPWQVHVYGSASAQFADWCAYHDVPLHVFDWRPEHEAAGLARNATYLLRPDTYVALADPSGAPDALERYCADHEVRAFSASR